MAAKRNSETVLLCLVAALLTSACGELGKVDQGRVIRFEPSAGAVTIIRDSNHSDPIHPRYDVLPPVTLRIPPDPQQMGPAPAAGKLMLLDMQANVAVVFNPARQALENVRFTVLEKTDNVAPNDERLAAGRLPSVDRAQKAVTLYSPGTRQIVKLSIPVEFLSLPNDAWQTGDEVRYYFKEPGQALRMMNVTRTKIS